MVGEERQNGKAGSEAPWAAAGRRVVLVLQVHSTPSSRTVSGLLGDPAAAAARRRLWCHDRYTRYMHIP